MLSIRLKNGSELAEKLMKKWWVAMEKYNCFYADANQRVQAVRCDRRDTRNVATGAIHMRLDTHISARKLKFEYHVAQCVSFGPSYF